MLIRDIHYYLDTAKDKQGYKSDNQLGIALNFKGSGISFWRVGKAYPSDERMKQLAHMAGLDEEIALMDLNYWRAPDAVKSTYASILQKIAHTSAAIALILAGTIGYTPSAMANMSNDNAVSLYYVK